jgi:PAS domain S-box-containing protein
MDLQETDVKIRPINILIVEDERIVALDIRQSLKSLGYNVVGIASTGEKALELAKDYQPDLILMDIMLKGEMDGISTAELINIDLSVPIIYLTAYADENTIERAKVTAPFGYLLKPFEIKELHTTIEMALYNHRLETKLKESERWLYTTLRSVNDAMVATEADGKIKFINPAAEKLTGWLEYEAAGKDPSEVVIIENEQTGEMFESIVQKVLHEKRTISYNSNVCIKNKIGTRKYVTASASPIAGVNREVLGVVVTINDITEQRQADREKERLLEEVTDARERLKKLSRSLIEMQEADRRTVAYELHEEIGQTLTTAKINLQALSQSIKEENQINILRESIGLLDNTIKKVRSMSLQLRPSMIDDLGLIPAIRWFINSEVKDAGITASIEVENIKIDLPEEIENMAYRALQESVINIIKHSDATAFLVKIWLEENKFKMEISDNGKGMIIDELEKSDNQSGLLGVAGIKERVALIGGEFKMQSKPGEGTTLYFEFPATN